MGLMDYNARFYDATLGRFIQPDTVVPNATNPQAWNRYSYVGNNPIRMVDPSGHWEEHPLTIDGGPGGAIYGGLPRPKNIKNQTILPRDFPEIPEPCSAESHPNSDAQEWLNDTLHSFGETLEGSRILKSLGQLVMDGFEAAEEYARPTWNQIKGVTNLSIAEGPIGAVTQFLSDFQYSEMSISQRLFRAGIVGVEDIATDVVSGTVGKIGAVVGARVLSLLAIPVLAPTGFGEILAPALGSGGAFVGMVAGSYFTTIFFDNSVWPEINKGWFPDLFTEEMP